VYARELEKKLGKDLDISFCTSGILFDQEKLDFIAQSKIFLAWSIDGPAHIHDRNRLLANGK
jgi:sulfatase maturation enzyme AslB (radical SAM superfamily)